MLPKAAGRGQNFQVRGHSFSLYGPTLSRQMTYLFFPAIIHIIIWQGKSECSDWFFFGRDFTIRTVSTETVQAVYQIYLPLKLLKENMWNTLFLRMEEDDDELANSKTSERIQWQPTCIRAWTLLAQHLQYYFRKYICAHASSINLTERRTRQQQFPIFFTSSLFSSFNILKTISLQIEKKTSIEAQSEGHALVDKTSWSYLADWWKRIQKDALSEARDFGDSNPVALERSGWWMLSPQFGSQSRNESRKLRW